MSLNPDEEMKMTYTSVVTKDNKPMISLRFERGSDVCEGVVPECSWARTENTRSSGAGRIRSAIMKNTPRGSS